jgi:hypothetical protein
MPLALPIANRQEPSTPESLKEHAPHRILNSPQLARAEIQRRLLDYFWQHTAESLNEYAIATDAFGHKAGIDSTVDACLRVHIPRLLLLFFRCGASLFFLLSASWWMHAFPVRALSSER